MSRKLHLHTVTTAEHATFDTFDPFEPTAPLSVPLGGGLVAVVHDGPTPLTVADLSVHRSSAALLWQQAATDMLSILGDLTAVHGTALRHRDDGGGVREIAVIGAPFPAAGLIAHPLLAIPTHRILGGDDHHLSPTASVHVTADQRLFVSSGPTPSVPCTGPIDISAGHCKALESVP
ncbi:hypothetical protein ACT3SZ_13700 [Corynebacterium sp. AOP40-9SA-29]|uniref:hypothetical protein n=1 Tax=Corynebacterium sp. AOP40-9SA-29 TaxID=3457677 RepID=UPI00403321EA